MKSRLATHRLASLIRRASGLMMVVALWVPSAYTRSGDRLRKFKSPDGKLTAVVLPVGKQKGFEEDESRISILLGKRRQLREHDFSSEDGEHGYGVDGAHWTPDSQFFVCRMRSSGGHSPTHAPVVFWSRKKNRFYQLDPYTADMTFSVSSPDKVNLDTWPGLNPATVSLGGVKEDQVTELR